MEKNCPSGSRRKRLPAAFTLIEVLVAISIASIAGSVLLLGITSSTQTTTESLQQTIALGMAQQLMDKAVGEPNLPLGITQDTPPVDPWGIELGKDDGEGDQRHSAFQAPDRFFENWRQVVDVYYVDDSDLVTRLPTGQDGDPFAVEVSIYYDHPGRGSRLLATLRQVIAYVP